MSKANTIAGRLVAAREAYYNTDKPLMADEEFDALERKLRKLMPEHAYFTKVGALVTNTLAQVKHATRLGSLDNAFTEEELAAWVSRTVKGLEKKDLGAC